MADYASRDLARLLRFTGADEASTFDDKPTSSIP